MRKLVLAAAVAALSISASFAAEDPIASRKALMQSMGATAGLSAGMMKGEIPYSPAAGKAAIASVRAVAATFGDYFPAGSDTGDTTAGPKIWQDNAAFMNEMAELAEVANAAAAASGKDGPADLDAFKAAMGPVLGTCKDCHEGYRVKK